MAEIKETFPGWEQVLKMNVVCQRICYDLAPWEIACKYMKYVEKNIDLVV